MPSFGVISVEEQKNILILKMHSGSKSQNAVNLNFVNCFSKALDFCESCNGEKSLIITGSSDKFFCVGFDMNELFRSNDAKLRSRLISGFMKIVNRLLIFPMPTISAINGHCYAGGVMLAMACDWRIMINNCGHICLSEVKLGVSIPNGLRELIRLKMEPNTLRTSTLSAKKFSCKEAFDGKIIDEMVMNRNNLLKRCIEFGCELSKYSKNRANYTRLKYDMYYVIVDELDKAVNAIAKSKL
eukprot:51265_1